MPVSPTSLPVMDIIEVKGGKKSMPIAIKYKITKSKLPELPRSSAVRLASLRDLPAQLLELYQQGFLLVALHPFVQPTHKQEKTPLEHIFRAILIKKTDRLKVNSKRCVLAGALSAREVAPAADGETGCGKISLEETAALARGVLAGTCTLVSVHGSPESVWLDLPVRPDRVFSSVLGITSELFEDEPFGLRRFGRSQKADLHGEGYVLELDCCSSLAHLTDQKIIPEFVKKAKLTVFFAP
ncbi:Raftlin [Camelus dromedarius]|uniref:Raftlin n=1 Tax=Camelus dromedarius TaxID=9838 RepID=A0A5N4EJ30_CAMDR|nr:Raftlin [Camelus dromedarius]